MSYGDFFRHATDGLTPYPWQVEVAENGLPEVLSVPTGLGKTEGVALAWAYRLLRMKRTGEPRHLIYCLPMRVLVQQTRERLHTCFDRLRKQERLDVDIHVLLGGDADESWTGEPEKPWVLVGTQDMLLSRALNRGYGMSRFKWPLHFGLVNNDCRWIVDEVQLMGSGLWTTAQLDWMRQKRFRPVFSCPTTWMSATLGLEFLGTTDRKRDALDRLKPFVMEWALPVNASAALRARVQTLRDARRPVEIVEPPKGKRVSWESWLVDRVVKEHESGALSLIVCNTVEKARAIFEALPKESPKILITSRFRTEDRGKREQRLIAFEEGRKAAGAPAIPSDPGLICVSTQVIEAGMDISAHRLWSEIAPWPSIVQRLGRLNRDGLDQRAKAIFWSDDEPVKKKGVRIGPYLAEEIAIARDLLSAYARESGTHPSCDALTALEGKEKAKLQMSLAPKPEPLPRAIDVHGLFSTERDLFGGFTDVSAFVRDSDPDADVSVFWREWTGKAAPGEDDLIGPDFHPAEAVAVPCGKLEGFLKQSQSLAWMWDDERGRWESMRYGDIRPGMRLMLPNATGGYAADKGWTGRSADRLNNVPPPGPGRTLRDDVRTEIGYWADLLSHLADARKEAEDLCGALGLDEPLARAVIQANDRHDIGKAHPQWLHALPTREVRPHELLAKSPHGYAVEVEQSVAQGEIARIVSRVANLVGSARRLSDETREQPKRLRLRWAVGNRPPREITEEIRGLPGVRWAGQIPFRHGIRHEAASALAMWHRYATSETKPFPALSVYLAASHHGKVRTVLRATSRTRADVFGVPLSSAPLELMGERWPMDFSIAADGAAGNWDGDTFVMTGPGWTEIVADLLGSHETREDPGPGDESQSNSRCGAVPFDEPRDLGPFALAYLEALVRIADWRASDRPSHPEKP
jgi:CRISPR-associated endonuclease/helicase Cas3